MKEMTIHMNDGKSVKVKVNKFDPDIFKPNYIYFENEGIIVKTASITHIIINKAT